MPDPSTCLKTATEVLEIVAVNDQFVQIAGSKLILHPEGDRAKLAFSSYFASIVG